MEKPGITISGVDVDQMSREIDDKEFDPNHLSDDGSAYDSLTEYYENALYQFAKMVSLGIPDKSWLGKDAFETEAISVAAGVKACGKCVKKLREAFAGEKHIEIAVLDKGKFDNLEDWYTDAFMEFIHTISSKVPEKFQKSTPEITQKNSIRSAIEAFEAIQKRLTS